MYVLQSFAVISFEVQIIFGPWDSSLSWLLNTFDMTAVVFDGVPTFWYNRVFQTCLVLPLLQVFLLINGV